MQATLIPLGEFAPAGEHFEKALSLYDPECDRDDSFRYTQNPGVGMRCHGAWALWFLGQPDQALQRMEEALALARKLSEPHGLAHAFTFSAILHQLRREPRISQERAETAIAVSRQHGLALYHAHATITWGWGLIDQGRQKEAIEQMRQGLAAQEATGTELERPHFLALLAEALGKNGQTEEGLRKLEKALSLVHQNGEREYQAELYRLKGELLLMQATGRRIPRGNRRGKAVVYTELPEVAQAKEYFHQSIRFAQQQKAKSWELRAVLSLARLLQKQGRKKEARQMLEKTYGSFTEGFATADLIEARALLDELAQPSAKRVGDART